jgi:rhodanese-related sulfurtransferase
MSDPSAIDMLLTTARSQLDRVDPVDLSDEITAGALLIDTRPVEQRQRDGALSGAIVIDRNVLEWRLDLSSPFRIPQITSVDQRIIIVCDQGYSSSLAAAASAIWSMTASSRAAFESK